MQIFICYFGSFMEAKLLFVPPRVTDFFPLRKLTPHSLFERIACCAESFPFTVMVWLSLDGTSLGHLAQPPAPAGTPRAACPGLCPDSFWMSPRRRFHTLSGQSVPLFSHLHGTEVFPDAQTEPLVLHFVPLASCPCTTTDTNWALSLHPPFRYLLLSTGSSPEPLLQAEQSWLPQSFFTREVLPSLTHLGLSLLSVQQLSCSGRSRAGHDYLPVRPY